MQRKESVCGRGLLYAVKNNRDFETRTVRSSLLFVSPLVLEMRIKRRPINPSSCVPDSSLMHVFA
jgi:hypothetical protein